jgi:hypothetical protein
MSATEFWQWVVVLAPALCVVIASHYRARAARVRRERMQRVAELGVRMAIQDLLRQERPYSTDVMDLTDRLNAIDTEGEPVHVQIIKPDNKELH